MDVIVDMLIETPDKTGTDSVRDSLVTENSQVGPVSVCWSL